MTDDQFFLANAYLDGELTAEERTRAEADPEVMAEVAELRAIQDMVRDVEPPTASARDDAIAAAMAVFGDGAAAATATPAPVLPIPHRARPAYGRYLAVAAGVLGVGLLGVAIANSGLGGDDDSASEPAADEPAADETAEVAAADEPASDDGVDRMVEESAADDAADEPASEPASDDAAYEPAADEPASDEPMADKPADEPADEPADAEEPASEPADTGDTGLPPVVLGQVLTTPEELGSYGNLLIGLRDRGELPPTPLHSCAEFTNALGRVEYLDALQPDAPPLDLLLDVREDQGYVVAFDPEACVPVVDGPLREP